MDCFSNLCSIYNQPVFSVEAGHHQQHHHPKHDVHQDVAEVWSVGRQPSEHRLRPGLLHGAAAAAGKPLKLLHAPSGGPSWVLFQLLLHSSTGSLF